MNTPENEIVLIILLGSLLWVILSDCVTVYQYKMCGWWYLGTKSHYIGITTINEQRFVSDTNQATKYPVKWVLWLVLETLQRESNTDTVMQCSISRLIFYLRFFSLITGNSGSILTRRKNFQIIFDFVSFDLATYFSNDICFWIWKWFAFSRNLYLGDDKSDLLSCNKQLKGTLKWRPPDPKYIVQ